jgi:hypothetical protein
MKKLFCMAIMIISASTTGCSAIHLIDVSVRMEEARAENAGKQLVPKDGGSYLIPVGTEPLNYLGTGDTNWKINGVTFTQPKGTYSILKVSPGAYTAFGDKLVVGGGQASSLIEVKVGEAVCFYPFSPIPGLARLEIHKNEACDPILRPLRQMNVVSKL